MRVKNKRLQFSNGYCPACGTDFQNKDNIVGHEIPELYDGILFWKCNNCNIYHYRFNKRPLRKKEFESYIKQKIKERGLR